VRGGGRHQFLCQKPHSSLIGIDGLSSKQVGSQASRRVTQPLAWIRPVCISINAVPTLKGLTLCMLGNFFKHFFLSKDANNHCFPPNILLIYNLNVKQFGSQMKPYILWGFIWIHIVCKGHQRSSKFTASGLRVKMALS